MAKEKTPQAGPRPKTEADIAFDLYWESQAKVAFKVHLPKETLDLLRDLSLARAITDLAAAVKISGKGQGYRQPSISKVITQMVEERRTALEQEVEIVRGNLARQKVKVVEGEVEAPKTAETEPADDTAKNNTAPKK